MDCTAETRPFIRIPPKSCQNLAYCQGRQLDQATNIFGSSGVNITSSGQKHLGAALGSTEFVKKFVKKKVAEWCEEVICLSTIAKRERQAAYAAFVHGVIHRWNYILRTIPNISELLTPLEEAIRYQLIPAITGRSTVSDTEQDVLALPCLLGGMGLINPVKSSMLQYECSDLITAPLVELITTNADFSQDTRDEMTQAKLEMKKKRRNQLNDDAARIHSELNAPLKRSVDLAKDKGASSWLPALPLENQGFSLYRSAFRDALALQYNWLPDRMPNKCACVSHSPLSTLCHVPKEPFLFIATMRFGISLAAFCLKCAMM